jgi:hypothetical protein
MTSWQKQRAFASDLTTHGDYRGDCPFCGGKNTYTATIGGGALKWNCYKMDCHVSGIHDTDMTAEEIMNLMNKTVKQTRQQEAETMEIPVYVVKPTGFHDKFHRFTKRYGLAVGGLLYDVKDERVVFPIKHKGRIIDAIGRAVGKKRFPKWYRYSGEANYFTMGSGSKLLIVEDVVSAIVAWQEFPDITSMAILGTQLTTNHLEKIREYNKVIIALDPDAAKKTIQYRREIEQWTGVPTKALSLFDDIKYRVDTDMEKLKDMLV